MILEDRREVERDIEETLGLVPEFFRRVPDYLLPTEWASFKSLELSDSTAGPDRQLVIDYSMSDDEEAIVEAARQVAQSHDPWRGLEALHRAVHEVPDEHGAEDEQQQRGAAAAEDR